MISVLRAIIEFGAHVTYPLPSGEYCIELINGPSHNEPVASARVTVDGATIWSESAFNKNFPGDSKVVSIDDESASISVHIKSGQKKDNSVRPDTLELRLGRLDESGGTPTPLNLIGPEGGQFEVDGVQFTFAPDAVDQDTLFSVTCEVPYGGIARRCDIHPHQIFEPGTVQVTFPIFSDQIPEYLDWSNLRGYHDGDPSVNFGPRFIAEGSNHFFVVLASGAVAPAGCEILSTSPPYYRTADLTVTRYTEELVGSSTPAVAGMVDYWRHEFLLDFIYSEIVQNSTSFTVENIREYLRLRLTTQANSLMFNNLTLGVESGTINHFLEKMSWNRTCIIKRTQRLA